MGTVIWIFISAFAFVGFLLLYKKELKNKIKENHDGIYNYFTLVL